MKKKDQIPEVEILSKESSHLYEVLNAESDLACVLIATSYLDYSLAAMLKRHFINSSVTTKLLDPPRGAISTFASRTDLAYCLGLIPKGLYQNLENIGKIRNAFAHSYLSMGLADAEIVKIIEALIPPTITQSVKVDGDKVTHSTQIPFSLSNLPRDKFNIIVVLMVNSLLLTGLGTKTTERKVSGWN